MQLTAPYPIRPAMDSEISSVIHIPLFSDNTSGMFLYPFRFALFFQSLFQLCTVMEDHGSKNQYNAQYHTEPIAPFHVLRQTKICRNKSSKNHSNQRQNNALNPQPADSVCTAFTVPKLLLRWLISIMVFIRYHLFPSSSVETKKRRTMYPLFGTTGSAS